MRAATPPVRELETVALRAWPALEEISVDGWLVRFANGYTGRANSVNPLGPVAGDTRERVRECERLFRERGLRPLFRLTPLREPPDLADLLERDGYLPRLPTRVMTRRLDPSAVEPTAGLELRDAVDDSWLRLFTRWTAVPEEHHATLRSMLESIRPEHRFALLRHGGEPVACGLAVRDGPRLGLFELVTAAASRRRGHGARLVEGLLAWGVAGGARSAYLQVDDDNEPARRLYRRHGFEDAYPYSYRLSSETGPYRTPYPVPPPAA